MQKSNIKKALKTVLFYIILIGAWQLISFVLVDVTHVIRPYMFSSPIQVVARLGVLCANGVLPKAVGISLSRLFSGFIISCLVGILLSLALLKSKTFYDDMRSLLAGTQALPNVCWLPFAILWCGINDSAIIFVIVLGSAFSLALSLDSAIKSINPIYVKVAKTMSCNIWTMATRIIIPAAMPGIINGLRQTWAFAWRALMASEVLNASVGLGYLMTMGRELSDMSQVMGVMLVIMFIGIVFDKLIFGIIESRVRRDRGLF
ncbi:MAG: ABC transporter permease [Ruminococcaceae bacterium]|nr:ABC transporter permease [Oscillospiraceae bacterium]